MMRRLSLKRGLPLLACAMLVLSGCSGLADRVSSNIDDADANTSGLVKEVGHNARGAVMPAAPRVVHEDGIWLGKNVVKLGQPSLPPVFYQPATFDRSIHSLAELAERLTLRSGIPSRVNADAATIAAGSFKRGRGSLPALPAVRPSSSLPVLPLPPGAPGEGALAEMSPRGAASAGGANANGGENPGGDANVSFQPDLQGGIRFTYANGSFKGMLDTVAARFGVSWKYGDGVIQFYHTDARTFQISAVPGDASFAANVTSGSASTGGVGGGSGSSGSGGSGGGSGGSSVNASNSQNTGVVSKLSVYAGIESAVKLMLSPYGKVLAAPATGSITVVDTPDTLDRIAAYLENANKALSRQIVMNVTVLSVNLDQGDEYGINWNLVYKNLKTKYGVVNTFAGASDAAGVFSAGIVGNSKFAGSSLIMKALAEQGKVRRQTTASVVTLNNQPVPVQVARQTSYLQSSQTSIVAQVGATTTLVPGVVTAGFNMSILPHVLNNGTVMLQFSVDMSTLRRIRPIEGTNGTRIESPEIDTRNFLQRVSMKSGETLVIGGFEQTDENVDRQGVGQASNFLLGGGVAAKSNKEVIVILITPVAMAGA
ncbi:type IVB pilus formation R64 PilN family outer membrane protein [Massilia violacea]|uniref:Type IVB pilus formation R64 PilN family outer membrane protein n=2 Tax=Pseudoduganella violacea TaxID=1715466 RepID=A0A7W5FWW9_9BURK|nr:type IVB pilus formation R64 PilN family outer membrane protein [Pseudoduganella violacea]